MFNKDFYPTPESVIEMMGIDCKGKVILEPSAGKGNIVDFLKRFGAKEILACEINADLAQIVKSKTTFLKSDFFAVDKTEIGHVDLIVMNPPFSKCIQHILHAYEIAPEGCEIISLVNADTYSEGYYQANRELEALLQNYGTFLNLGPVFSSAERTTNVDIGLIRIYKPKTNRETEFDGFFMDEDDAPTTHGLVPYNEIQTIVSHYVGAVRCFDKVMEIGEEMNPYHEFFDLQKLEVQIAYKESVSSKQAYKSALQKKAWGLVFAKLNVERFVTSGVMQDVNTFVEQQKNVPFTMKNIYRMCDILMQNRASLLDRSLEEVIDQFTKHTHENRYNVEGWKTNSGHLLNKKIIIPNALERSFSSHLTVRYSGYADKIEDLIKVLCFLTGTNYNDTTPLRTFTYNLKMQPGVWYSWGFFEAKGFKKGTLHLKFQNEKVWEQLNRKYAEIKGQVLPEKI